MLEEVKEYISKGLCPSCAWRERVELVNGVCPQCGLNWDFTTAQQSVHLTAERLFLAVSVFINVTFLAVILFLLCGR